MIFIKYLKLNRPKQTKYNFFCSILNYKITFGTCFLYKFQYIYIYNINVYIHVQIRVFHYPNKPIDSKIYFPKK